MIKSKSDLRRCLSIEDELMSHPSMLKKWITFSDDFYPFLLQKCLRHYEYYLNKKKKVWDYIPYFWYWWNFRRLRVKTGIVLFPNTIEEGLSIVHPGFRRIARFSRIGKNCTILPNVLFGKKKPGIGTDIHIGDDCYISTGVTILGPIKIGNNVTIGAGAVVTKDIPDNAVVGGVPAKVIRMKE